MPNYSNFCGSGSCRVRVAVLATLVLLALSCVLQPFTRQAQAQAQQAAYPSQPIRFIVPFPPGSGTDISARFFASRISVLAKQPVLVENKPGANGFIAINAMLSAPPDGYTVFIGGTSAFTTNLVSFKTLPYDPVNDLTPVGILMRGPSALVVAKDSPIDSLRTMVDRARASPGTINSATGAVSYQLAAAAFYQRAGIDVKNIPFKGASEAVTSTASKVVDVAFVDLSSALPLIRGGVLRALAVSSGERMAELPDVPTFIESGYPGYTTFNWSGAAVSSKTPPAIVVQLGNWFDQVASRAETRAELKNFVSEPVPGGPAEMRRLQLSEIERWRGIAASAGVVPQ